jgi:HlyD family secretion protein
MIADPRSRAGLAGALSLLALQACSKPEPAPRPVVEHAARVARVDTRTLADPLRLSGALVAREEAAVSTELNGYRVAKVLADLGDRVRAGQPLAVLDDALLRGQIAQQAAVVEQQAVAAERAEQEAARVAGLDKLGALSPEAVAERALQARSAKAALAQAQAVLADLRLRQSMMVVRAPVSGRVLSRSVRPGEVAAAGQVMFRLARDGLVELDAEAVETRLGGVAPGARASVRLPDGQTLSGTVRLVSPEVDPQTKLGRVRVQLPLSQALHPGGFAEATISARPRQAVTAPQSAVLYDGDGASLLVVGEGERVRKVAVKTGILSGDRVEIVQGVHGGERVVLSGGALLLPGDKVKATEVAVAQAGGAGAGR